VQHIEINESFESFIKIIMPIFKENKEYCTIIKPDVFGYTCCGLYANLEQLTLLKFIQK
jgi:hypothetical protein